MFFCSAYSRDQKIAFDRSGTVLAVASEDGSVKCLNCAAKDKVEIVADLKGHEDAVQVCDPWHNITEDVLYNIVEKMLRVRINFEVFTPTHLAERLVRSNREILGIWGIGLHIPNLGMSLHFLGAYSLCICKYQIKVAVKRMACMLCIKSFMLSKHGG